MDHVARKKIGLFDQVGFIHEPACPAGQDRYLKIGMCFLLLQKANSKCDQTAPIAAF